MEESKIEKEEPKLKKSLTKPAIMRIFSRAGCTRITDKSTSRMREILLLKLKQLIEDTIIIAKCDDKKTIKKVHLEIAMNNKFMNCSGLLLAEKAPKNFKFLIPKTSIRNLISEIAVDFRQETGLSEIVQFIIEQYGILLASNAMKIMENAKRKTLFEEDINSALSIMRQQS